MKHISFKSYRGMVEQGLFRMPGTMHETYCRAHVRPHEIDDDNPTCDDCMDAKTWEIIDAELGSLVEV